MSGGHFDYDQYKIGYIADSIEYMIEKNDFRTDVLHHMKNAIKVLRTAEIYAQRVDYFVSGDDSADDFLRRLHDDLKELNDENL